MPFHGPDSVQFRGACDFFPFNDVPVATLRHGLPNVQEPTLADPSRFRLFSLGLRQRFRHIPSEKPFRGRVSGDFKLDGASGRPQRDAGA